MSENIVAVWLLGVAGALLFVLWISWTYFIGAVWSSTPKSVVRRMLEIADVGKGDIVYDLGCGDGRIVIEAAKRGASAVGLEIDPLRVLLSSFLVRISGQSSRARIELRNFMDDKTNLKGATVVTLFLTQGTNDRLESRLKRLPEGTRVVSYVWKFKNWKPTAVDRVERVYLYTVN